MLRVRAGAQEPRRAADGARKVSGNSYGPRKVLQEGVRQLVRHLAAYESSDTSSGDDS